MDDLVKALETAVQNKNWYGALFVALAVPDICGYLESPNDRSQARYERWFEKYMLPKYSSHVGGENTQHIFLSSSDCYALRCALIHECREEIIEQKARETLERFHFIEPPPNIQIHCNKSNNNVLQLQVDIFCKDVLEGLQNWRQDAQDSDEIKQRIDSILKVYPYNQLPGMSIGN